MELKELDMPDYISVNKVQATMTSRAHTEPPERRVLHLGILTLAVLCILQATINITLRLVVHSKVDSDQLQTIFSKNPDLCRTGSEQNLNQVCSCCIDLLKQREKNEDLKRNIPRDDDYFGSGSPDDYIDQEMNNLTLMYNIILKTWQERGMG